MMSFQERLFLMFLAILPVLKVACINVLLSISSSPPTLEWLTVTTTASAPSVRIGLTPWTEAPSCGTAWRSKNSWYHPKSRYAFSVRSSSVVKLSFVRWNHVLCRMTKTLFLHVWFCICRSSCTASERKNQLYHKSKYPSLLHINLIPQRGT